MTSPTSSTRIRQLNLNNILIKIYVYIYSYFIQLYVLNINDNTQHNTNTTNKTSMYYVGFLRILEWEFFTHFFCLFFRINRNLSIGVEGQKVLFYPYCDEKSTRSKKKTKWTISLIRDQNLGRNLIFSFDLIVLPLT